MPNQDVETLAEDGRPPDDGTYDFDGLREFMRPLNIEGIVFHRADGEMCKIRKADYGMERKP